MDIIKTLIARVEEARLTNKTPCKSYKHEHIAMRAGHKMARLAGNYFYAGKKDTDLFWNKAQPARFCVVYVESWGRYVVGIDLTELLARPTSTGGYLGICTGFFVY
jgi:hypothetical protein